MTEGSKLSRAARDAALLSARFTNHDGEPNAAWLVPFSAGLVAGVAAARSEHVEPGWDQSVASLCDYVSQAARDLDPKKGR